MRRISIRAARVVQQEREQEKTRALLPANVEMQKLHIGRDEETGRSAVEVWYTRDGVEFLLVFDSGNLAVRERTGPLLWKAAMSVLADYLQNTDRIVSATVVTVRNGLIATADAPDVSMDPGPFRDISMRQAYRVDRIALAFDVFRNGIHIRLALASPVGQREARGWFVGRSELDRALYTGGGFHINTVVGYQYGHVATEFRRYLQNEAERQHPSMAFVSMDTAPIVAE